MTLTDERKTLDEKIKANEALYDLAREAAKISALSSPHVIKALTGESDKRSAAELPEIQMVIFPLIIHEMEPKRAHFLCCSF